MNLRRKPLEALFIKPCQVPFLLLNDGEAIGQRYEGKGVLCFWFSECWSCCLLHFWGLSGFEAVASCSHESGLLDSCLQIHTMCSGPTFPQMIAKLPTLDASNNEILMFLSLVVLQSLVQFLWRAIIQVWESYGWCKRERPVLKFCLGSYRKVCMRISVGLPSRDC